MKLKVIGSGGAFASIEKGNSSFLLYLDNGEKLLFDCGTAVPYTIRDVMEEEIDTDHIFISHIHADHVGGLEFVGFYRYFKKMKKPILWLPDNIAEEVRRRLLVSMCTGNYLLSDFFDIHEFHCNFQIGDTLFETVERQHCRGMSSNGLIVRDRELNLRLFISGDGLSTPEDIEILESAGTILHDCETLEIPSGVHAHYRDLLKIPEHCRGKMLLYHFTDIPVNSFHESLFLHPRDEVTF